MANVQAALAQAREAMANLGGLNVPELDSKIGAVLLAVEGLADEFSKFRNDVTAELDELRDRLGDTSV
jgi:hypothetical protein